MSSFIPWMVSPSSSTTARTVPCMAGWLGPRLTSIRFDGNGASRGLSAGAAGTGRRLSVSLAMFVLSYPPVGPGPRKGSSTVRSGMSGWRPRSE